MDVTQDVIGLEPGRYYVCAIGSSYAGTGVGAVVAFEVRKPSSSGGGCGTGGTGGAAAAALGLLALAAVLRRRSRGAG